MNQSKNIFFAALLTGTMIPSNSLAKILTMHAFDESF